MKIVFIIGIVCLFLLAGCQKGPGEYDTFAQCLTEKNVTMYGTDWCPHCKNQKALFGNSFQYVDYVNCEINKVACQKAGVRGYPTWIIKGESFSGTQGLATLSVKSGCEMVKDTI